MELLPSCIIVMNYDRSSQNIHARHLVAGSAVHPLSTATGKNPTNFKNLAFVSVEFTIVPHFGIYLSTYNIHCYVKQRHLVINL